ncbi:MAG: NADH:ubiquinone oxidoreductase 27 kD subunit-like protein [Frankiales bacterium]|nr:NADH:ubiquinone oxidoreductase 27 kD subunit-like protein [Frankiales bacterium]
MTLADALGQELTTSYGVVVGEVDRTRWSEVAAVVRDQGYSFFDLLTAVDLEADGFEVLLRLWDPVRHEGVVLRTRCPRDDARVPTLTPLFAGAGWHERATAELFGVAFDGHDTARLLLPESFAGHPLRKEFVLAARVAKRWPGAKEPGESEADLATPSRRRPQPPGVPTGWGPP